MIGVNERTVDATESSFMEAGHALHTACHEDHTNTQTNTHSSAVGAGEEAGGPVRSQWLREPERNQPGTTTTC